MPYISAADAPSFGMHGASFSALAAPTRGSTENVVWIVTLQGGTPALPHRVTREEILVVLEGQAVARIGSQEYVVEAGGALVVPANTEFELANPYEKPFRAVAVLPVGGQAKVGDQPAFTPPWAL